MNKMDWVLENKQEEVKELVMSELCPSHFGLNDRDEPCGGEQCKECWNEEMEDE